MRTHDVTSRSPLRRLEQSMQGGLGRGRVGVVAARSGVGKTALLVQIGLDALLRGSRVVHVSNDSPVDHLRAWYDELFHEIERGCALENAPSVLLDAERRRLLMSQPGSCIRIDRLRDATSLAKGTLGGEADLVIIEGVDFSTASASQLQALSQLAQDLNAELWLSARTYAQQPAAPALGYPPPVDRAQDHIDVVVTLEPSEGRVRVRVLKDHDASEPKQQPIVLDAVTFQLLQQEADAQGKFAQGKLERFTLHSGGARGAEAAFGETAERYGISEVTFSFEGHSNRVRSRGLKLLTDDDLRVGDVSLRYVSHRLGRQFPEPPSVRKVLQSIWYQIRPCGQVFVVGTIQNNGIVRGGTGWGAELARRWNKPLFVFDQGKDGWFGWTGDRWQPVEPRIEAPCFAGTGTRDLEPNGARAIEALFERSFGMQG
jgi:hypothetical protein